MLEARRSSHFVPLLLLRPVGPAQDCLAGVAGGKVIAKFTIGTLKAGESCLLVGRMRCGVTIRPARWKVQQSP